VAAEHKNVSVIWIPATNKESLMQAYLNTAKELGISGLEDDKADVKRLVQDHLSSERAGQWLLVFDNADDISMWIDKPQQESDCLIDYLPKSGHGSIVFTTRDKKAAVRLAGQNIVEMSEMDETGARQLLQKYILDQDLLDNQEDATTLLARLTNLPLAIVQATAYINGNGISIRDYISLLEEQEEDVIDLLSEEFEDERRYRDIKNPVATTWLISFEQIRQRDPLAANYLSFMACIDAKDIPQSLLPPFQSRKKEIDAIGTLQGYSFISKRSADMVINIHRLVHLATRNWLRKEGLLSYWSDRVIARLAEVLMDVDRDNRVVWRSYMPHAYYALRSSLASEDNEHKLDLLWRYGMCLYDDGRYQEAETLFKQVMESHKTKLETDHPDTLASMNNLASVYVYQGRWEEAEKLNAHVMETSKMKLGADHHSTLSSMANIAVIYVHQGRLEEAEKLNVHVMETNKIKLGADHHDTLISISNLAGIYKIQGRLEEAEKLDTKVMETRMMKLGVDHPDTLISINNLAEIYRLQGRLEEAERFYMKVMETRKIKLGSDHPSTLKSIQSLARVYRTQGRLEEAEKLAVSR
jgi:Flp pilus assembly protein TadD